VIEVVAGGAAAAPGRSLVVRVAPYTGHTTVREASVGVAVADPMLAQALTAAIAQAVRDAAPTTEPPECVRTVQVRSRKGLARDVGRLGGAIAIVPVTARNARHLVALVDGARAAGAIGVQLVWDGADPPRAAVEHHVFAALERARATPSEPPVVLATSDQLVPALCFLVAHRQLNTRRDEPR
jgi:hypothetical protein